MLHAKKAYVARPTVHKRGFVVNEQSRRYLQGLLMIALAALCWSTAGVIVRELSVGGWETSFWRSLIMTVVLLPVMGLYRSGGGQRPPLRAFVASGILLAATFNFFILALAHASVANVLIVMASAPFLTAVIGRVFLGEPVSAFTWVAIAIAVAGIALTVIDSLSAYGWLGSLLAFLTVLSFSVNTNILRRYRQGSMLPGILLAGILSALAAVPFAWPLQITSGDILPLMLLGVGQLGLGLALFTLGARRVPGAQAALVALLEPVLGPIWVWLAFAERPGDLGLLGAALVIAAILFNGVMTLRHGDRRTPDLSTASTSIVPD